MQYDHDVIIVGAGPAGSSTALHLAKKAPALVQRTLILEKDRHPRHKLCCGALSGDSLTLLERMGLNVREIPFIELAWMKLLFERRGFGLHLAPGYGLGIIRRDEFDGWLADKARAAGFAFQEDTRATAVRRVHGGVEVDTNKGTLRARAIVGADGTESVVRPAVAPNKHTGIGRTLEVVTPATSAGFPTAFCEQDEGYLDFRRIPEGNDGYTLSFPVLVKGVRKRSWAIWDSRATGGGPHGSLKKHLEEDMESQGFRLADYELRGFPIRWYEPEATLGAPGILLAGDAAGVDAMVGEGISQSLGYGALAAESLRDAFDRLDFSFSDYTSRVAKSPLGKNLALRTRLAKNLYRVRSRPVLAALFHRAGGPLKWFMEQSVFGWAR